MQRSNPNLPQPPLPVQRPTFLFAALSSQHIVGEISMFCSTRATRAPCRFRLTSCGRKVHTWSALGSLLPKQAALISPLHNSIKPRHLLTQYIDFQDHRQEYSYTSGFVSLSDASLCLISLATVKKTSSTFMFVLALW